MSCSCAERGVAISTPSTRSKLLREQQWKLDTRLEPASGAERAVRSHREVILVQD